MTALTGARFSRREKGKRRQVPQHRENHGDGEQRPQNFAGKNFRPAGAGFFSPQPDAAQNRRREQNDEQRVVLQRERKIAVQQRVNRARPAAARTVQAGQLGETGRWDKIRACSG
jgi:hypothetical protein